MDTLKLASQQLQKLEPHGRTEMKLPNNGFLFLEHDVPYLIVYRRKTKDRQTMRLAKTGASFLILGKDDEDYMHDFLLELVDRMAERFRSFLVVELEKRDLGSTEFIISGPYKKLPSTLDQLAKELEKIDIRYDAKLTATIVDSSAENTENGSPLFEESFLRVKGGTYVRLQIPPVYRTLENKEFPVFFRKFRTQFAKALQQSIYEFIRVQTTSKIASYHALGKRRIHEEVSKIDKEITAIQNSYSFLLLVAPINIENLKRSYFNNGFKNIGTYHYRLLPIDPDILKRKLYQLDIHEIDDPALAYIYDEKREEIDQELTMLKERGSKNFFYSSVRLYQDISTQLLKEAQLILNNIAEDDLASEKTDMDAYDFQKLAENEFDFFRKQAPDFRSKVHIRDDINIMMVAGGELYLPSGYRMTKMEARALIQHELGTHALTYFNGTRQPLQQLAHGLAGYDALQEGIAVLAEYLADALGVNRLRTLAGRVVAGDALLKGANFDDMFSMLYKEYGFAPQRAFDMTSRMFQGGGFLKDIVYLKGLLELRDHLANGGTLEPLLAGKFALRHLTIVQELTHRGLLHPPKIKPRYLLNASCDQKLRQFKKGMPLQNMV